MQSCKNSRSSRAHLPYGGDNRDFAYGEVVVLREDWLVSLKAIAMDDLQWLKEHPLHGHRVREITPVEVATTGLPPGTTVTVAALPDGKQLRRFYLPQRDAAQRVSKK